VLRKEFVEDFEVARLLVVHVLHKRPKMWMGFDYRRGLGGVDQGGCKFASLVDPQSAVKKPSLLFREDRSLATVT
jgi:hypothetical protein